MSSSFDAIVIGGGMAGASVAYELAAEGNVLVLEAEEQPGYHATGRSAAAYIPSYGFENLALRSLTLASRALLECPPEDFHAGSLLKPFRCSARRTEPALSMKRMYSISMCTACTRPTLKD